MGKRPVAEPGPVRDVPIRKPEEFANRIAEAANAAGLNAFASHAQSEHGVDRGHAWIRCRAQGFTARREGTTDGFRVPSDTYTFTDDEAADVEWALGILRTGRTIEVGPGVGLRDMQDAVRVHYETVDYPLQWLAEVARRPDDPWDLNPEYQRGHVWTPEQRCRFVGTFLVVQRMPLVFLNYGSKSQPRAVAEVVDGKQRLTSLLMFTDGDIPAWLPGDSDGARPIWWRDFDEVDRRCAPNITCGRVYLPTLVNVLRFYLNLNEGGTAHKPEEIAKVRAQLEAEIARIEAGGEPRRG